MTNIIKDYILKCEIQGNYFLTGDDKKSNKYHKIISQIIEQIKISDENIKKEFYNLMFSNNESVKIWTSTTLLKTFEETAKGELSKVMNKKAENINNSTAKIILEAYDKGLLTNIVDWKLLKK